MPNVVATIANNQSLSAAVDPWGGAPNKYVTADSANLGIVLAMYNGGGNLTGGDPANRVYARIKYSTLTLPV